MGQFRKTSDPRQRSSGLTMADFIVETGISNTSLYKWRQRLINESTYDPTKPVATNLIEVTVARQPARTKTHMTVRVAGDRRSIDVPIDFDDDALRRLVEVLESC
jgi:transposase-like protein